MSIVFPSLTNSIIFLPQRMWQCGINSDAVLRQAGRPPVNGVGRAGLGVWTVVGAGAGVRALTTVEDAVMMRRQNHVAHGREGLLALEQGN